MFVSSLVGFLAFFFFAVCMYQVDEKHARVSELFATLASQPPWRGRGGRGRLRLLMPLGLDI